MGIVIMLLSIILLGCGAGGKTSSNNNSNNNLSVSNSTYAIGVNNQLYISAQSGIWGQMPNQLTTASDTINNVNCGSLNCGFVTQNGKIFISSDLLNWSIVPPLVSTSQHIFGASPALISVQFANSAANPISTSNMHLQNISNTNVAVGANGTIITFTASGYTVLPPVTNNNLNSITQFILGSSASFIIVGNNGTILNSNDGVNWSILSNIPTNVNLNQVISLNNIGLWAVGNNGVILSSVDGINWRNQTSNTNQNLLTINYSNGMFTVGGAAGTILLSSDSATWYTPVIVPSGISNYNITQIGRSTLGGFIAYGQSIIGNPEILLTSQFGTTWTTVSSGTQTTSNSSTAAFFRSLGNLYDPTTSSINPLTTTSNTAVSVKNAVNFYTSTFSF